MYTLENTKLKKTLIALGATTLLSVTAIYAASVAVDGAVKYETKNGKYTSYHQNKQIDGVKNYGFHRPATEREIRAWNIDAMPDGTGLPEFDMKHGEVVLGEDGKPKKAQGDVAWGNEIYDAKCAMCHGDFGSGGKGYPKLSGGDFSTLKNQLQDPADEHPNDTPPSRAIGSYWPYASTLFWYIQDAMPFPNPKSLSNSETYALTAYLLFENKVKVDGKEMTDEFVLSKDNFSKIEMLNKDGFYPVVDTPKDPKQGVKNMTKFLADKNNLGNGTRCMKDCIKGPVPVLKIKYELKDFEPAPTTVRDLPKVVAKGDVHPGEAGYEANCSSCHSNEAIGAPVVGDKNSWAKVVAKGMDSVYDHAINGFNAMPPKGGNMDLSDDDVKKIVDYMVSKSK